MVSRLVAYYAFLLLSMIHYAGGLRMWRVMASLAQLHAFKNLKTNSFSGELNLVGIPYGFLYYVPIVYAITA